MNNYPPGAEYDPGAPFNEEEIIVEVYTLTDEDTCVYIDYKGVINTVSGEEILEQNRLFSKFRVEEEFKYIVQCKNTFEIHTNKKTFDIHKEDIIDYFFNK